MYDLMIVGAGPGGYVAAERAGRAGLSVVLFEKDSLGGVCLNVGCIPSKALLNSAKLYRHAVDSKAFGITSENVSFSQDTVVKRKKKVVRKLVAGVRNQMKEANVSRSSWLKRRSCLARANCSASKRRIPSTRANAS
jgi:dihydrolipoamide dehydrogenase